MSKIHCYFIVRKKDEHIYAETKEFSASFIPEALGEDVQIKLYKSMNDVPAWALLDDVYQVKELVIDIGVTR